MPKKKPAKLDSSVSEAPTDAPPKKHYNVTMDGDEDPFPDDIADIDLTPEAIAKWKASLPPKVRAEIEKELDAQMSEMTQKFEEHAKAYEKEHPETAPKHVEEIEKRAGDKGEPLPKAPKAKAERKGTARRKSPKA